MTWHVARIISSQKIYGLYGLKHHIVEMRGGVTDAGRTNGDERTLKIELLSQWKLEAEFRNIISLTFFYPPWAHSAKIKIAACLLNAEPDQTSRSVRYMCKMSPTDFCTFAPDKCGSLQPSLAHHSSKATIQMQTKNKSVTGFDKITLGAIWVHHKSITNIKM